VAGVLGGVGRGWIYLTLVALLGAAVAVLPAIASSEATSTVEATNGSGPYGEPHAWSPSQVSVIAGAVVTFSNPTAVEHGVEWVSDPTKPTCTSGVPVGTTAASAGPKWSGTCNFDQPGTYVFYCTVHGPEMTGTVVVSPTGTTTVTTTGTTTNTSTTGTSTTNTSPPAEESPIVGSTTQAVKIAKSQRGGSVHGSIDLSPAAVGSRLQVDLFTRRTALTGAKRNVRVRVGHLLRSSVSAGRLSFSVALDAKARRALVRRRRLALGVEVLLTPVTGKALRISRTVIEHR
jgi:plastocyanin